MNCLNEEMVALISDMPLSCRQKFLYKKVRIYRNSANADRRCCLCESNLIAYAGGTLYQVTGGF